MIGVPRPRISSAAVGRVTGRLHEKSLTWRLLAVLVVLLVVALTLTSLATSAIMRRYLVDRTVEELRTAAAPVAERVLPQYMNRKNDIDVPSTYVVSFMNTAGRPVATLVPSGIDAESVPDMPRLTTRDARVSSAEPFILSSPNASSPAWIVVAGQMSNASGTYAVATSLAGVEQAINKTIAASFTVSMLLVLGCVFIGWIGFRRAFRPLRTIEDTAAAIAAGDLSRRVPETRAHDEVQSLSRSINAMLAQIEESFRIREAGEQRMRRFVTDASHELRTPLATVRGYAELYRQGAASSPEQTAAAMSRIENEATRMAGLVDDLLTLARLDNARPMNMSVVDLTVLSADAVQDARARDREREIRLLSIDDGDIVPTEVVGDEARLRQVVTNLVANALSHTPAGSPIEVAVGIHQQRARVEVRDHGPGIEPEVASKVFERFYRNDPARGRKPSGGYGLGLAIVAGLIEAHGGRVGVAPTPGGGATFVFELPTAANSNTKAEPPASQTETPATRARRPVRRLLTPRRHNTGGTDG
ncbi:Probable sensor histidine kinase TcrY [Dermatophilus congolensis]|uniref:histidine kinase n=1 Tax=Dermatophilus congolensis TaxID=1863 RepID=A0AA46GZL5_9MICO|nr:Probable sensor histidine kinase TcrY [Dermatophilus congolensis]